MTALLGCGRSDLGDVARETVVGEDAEGGFFVVRRREGAEQDGPAVADRGLEGRAGYDEAVDGVDLHAGWCPPIDGESRGSRSSVGEDPVAVADEGGGHEDGEPVGRTRRPMWATNSSPTGRLSSEQSSEVFLGMLVGMVRLTCKAGSELWLTPSNLVTERPIAL